MNEEEKERHEAPVSQALTKPDLMNLEDESYLSAYLDDELDPADRLALEWAVESSPPLADQLLAIALARDAVTGLPRPSIPRDLAPAVVARIASNRRRARLLSFARPAQVLGAVSSFSAIAACLIFAIIRLFHSLHETPVSPIVVVQNQRVPAPSPHPISPLDPEQIPAPLPAPIVLNASDSPSKPPKDSPTLPVASIEPPPAPGEVSERDDRRVISGILGRSHVRRIMIVTDVIDAPKRVKDLIAQGGLETPEFGRISIRQEIVIDPDHAEAAEVFAVPIDERGRRSFVDRLKKDFPELTEEGQSSPELVTQLTEVGQVAILRGREVAPLGDPPHNLPVFIANREEAAKAPVILEANRGSPDLARLEKSGPVKDIEALRVDGDPGPKPASLDPEFVGPLDPNRRAPPKPGERVTLLVWVTRPSRR